MSAYAAVSKWGRLRVPPAADTASKKEWQRSKFRERKRAEISGTATGHNGPDSKLYANIQKSESLLCSGIEAVITGLTRNQFVGNHTWVRIPPLPPMKNDLESSKSFFI